AVRSSVSGEFTIHKNAPMAGFFSMKEGNSPNFALDGWGGRDRTSEWGNQNPLPYRLATPQRPGPCETATRIPRATTVYRVNRGFSTAQGDRSPVIRHFLMAN